MHVTKIEQFDWSAVFESFWYRKLAPEENLHWIELSSIQCKFLIQVSWTYVTPTRLSCEIISWPPSWKHNVTPEICLHQSMHIYQISSQSNLKWKSFGLFYEWHHGSHLESISEICLCKSMRNYLKNNPTKFHPDWIWSDGALGFFEEDSPTSYGSTWLQSQTSSTDDKSAIPQSQCTSAFYYHYTPEVIHVVVVHTGPHRWRRDRHRYKRRRSRRLEHRCCHTEITMEMQ